MNADDEPTPNQALTLSAGLWGAYYLTIFFHLSLLAALVTLPGRDALVFLTGWVALFGLIALAGWTTRVLIHDTLIGLNLRERLAIGFFIGSLVVTPIFFRASILRDGPLFVVAGLFFIAVRLQLAHRLLAMSLLAGWLAAYWCTTLQDLILLAGFAASWLFTAGMVRLTFMTDQYGTWPGSAVVRIARATAIACVPALAAGSLVAWVLWPAGGLTAFIGYSEPEAAALPPQTRVMDLPAPALGALLQQLLIVVMLIAAMIALLFLIRRWLLRRRKGSLAPVKLPGQEIAVDYSLNEPAAPGPTLPGLRGAILKLWTKWEGALAREGLGRHKSETADEFASRLSADHAAAAPPPEISRMLDLAHYSAATLKPRDVETMRGLVDEELAKQSLRVQGPAEQMEQI